MCFYSAPAWGKDNIDALVVGIGSTSNTTPKRRIEGLLNRWEVPSYCVDLLLFASCWDGLASVPSHCSRLQPNYAVGVLCICTGVPTADQEVEFPSLQASMGLRWEV